MKTIVLYSRDPGGANTIIPLIVPLRDKGFCIRLFGKGVALDKYRQAGFEGTDLGSLIPVISPAAIRNFLETERPDLMVTATSADDFTEKFLWLAGTELGIPSMAIVDQWVNYGIRFSEFDVSRISSYRDNKKHPYLPTRIIAMDEFAREEMISEGLPPERIRVCGQPYFETVLASKNSDASGNLPRAIPGVSDTDFAVVFASEPITLTYGESALHWGYTERTIFSCLAEALDIIANRSSKSMALIIRPHPKENPCGLADIAASCCSNVKWIIDTGSHSWELINRANLVCGMSSMFLIESLIMGKAILSIQIGLCRENPFVLDRRGILKSIVDKVELHNSLTEIICNSKQMTSAFEVITNPVAHIIAEMETLLCHN